MAWIETCTAEGCFQKGSLRCPTCDWQLYCCEQHLHDNLNAHKEYCLSPAREPNFMKDVESPSLKRAQDMYYDACEYADNYDDIPEIWNRIKSEMEAAIRISPKCSDAWGLLSKYYAEGPEKNYIKAIECCNKGLAQGLWYHRSPNEVINRSISYDHIENRGYIRLFYPKFFALYKLKRYQEAADVLKDYHRISHRADLVEQNISVCFLLKDYIQIRYLLNTYKQGTWVGHIQFSNLLYNFCKFKGFYDDGTVVTMEDLEQNIVSALKQNDLTPAYLLSPKPSDYRRPKSLSPSNKKMMSQYYVEECNARDAWTSVPGALEFLKEFHQNRCNSLPSAKQLVYLLKNWGIITVITKSEKKHCSKRDEHVPGAGHKKFKFAQGFHDDFVETGSNNICVYDTDAGSFKIILYSDVVEVPYWELYYSRMLKEECEKKVEEADDFSSVDKITQMKKEKNKRKKLKQKLKAAAKKKDPIESRGAVMRDGNSLDYILSFLVGITCAESQRALSKQVVYLYLVSATFRKTLFQNSSLKSLVFDQCELDVCGYGFNEEEDRYYDKFSNIMILTTVKYSGKFLLDISLSVRILKDELLTIISATCQQLERFQLFYSSQPHRFRYNDDDDDDDDESEDENFRGFPKHRCFSTNAIVQFFSSVSLLTHVHFTEINCSDIDVVKVESSEVINALNRHPLVSLKFNVCDHNWKSIANLISNKYAGLESISLKVLNDDRSSPTYMKDFVKAFSSAASSPSTLKCLTLYETSKYFNDSTMKALLPSLSNLRAMSINPVCGFQSIRSGITSTTLELISINCPSLTYLDVSSNLELTASGISRLLDSCKNLIYLDVTQTGICLEDIKMRKPLPLVFLWYSRGGPPRMDEAAEISERRKIQHLIDDHPQTFFLEQFLGMVNVKNPTHPLGKLSFEYSKSDFEVSKGFKRGVQVHNLTSDLYVSNFRSKQQQIICEMEAKAKK